MNDLIKQLYVNEALKSIEIIDRSLTKAREFYDRFSGTEIPKDMWDEYSEMENEVKSMIALRCEIIEKLRTKCGVFVI